MADHLCSGLDAFSLDAQASFIYTPLSKRGIPYHLEIPSVADKQKRFTESTSGKETRTCHLDTTVRF